MGSSPDARDKRIQTNDVLRTIREDSGADAYEEPIKPEGFLALGELGLAGFAADRAELDGDSHIGDRPLDPLEFTRYQESGSVSPYD